ncbi:hypothetical protein ACRAWD_10045 [Caulobacter segnis]
MEAQTAAAGELAVAESVALAPLGVILAGIAVAAAGVAAVFAVAAHDIGEKAGDLTKDMGLTEEQMERVKDKSVTMGDVAKATFEVLGERLKAAFGPGLKAIGDGVMAVYHTVTNVALKAAAFAVGVFAGAVQAIRVAWSVLPAAMGDIIISGVNLVLDGVGKMVNGAIGLANGLIGTVNWLAKKLGLSLELPELGQVQVAKLTNQFAGAAKSAGSAISAAFGNGFTGGFDGIMNIPAVVAGRAVEIAKERIQEQAGKISSAPMSVAGAQDTEADVLQEPEAMPRREDPARYERLEAFKLPDVEKLTTVPEVNLEAYNKQREPWRRSWTPMIRSTSWPRSLAKASRTPSGNPERRCPPLLEVGPASPRKWRTSAIPRWCRGTTPRIWTSSAQRRPPKATPIWRPPRKASSTRTRAGTLRCRLSRRRIASGSSR